MIKIILSCLFIVVIGTLLIDYTSAQWTGISLATIGAFGLIMSPVLSDQIND